MKHLILLLLSVFSFSSFSQIDLPSYVEDDTVYIKDGWVQDVKEEAKQRKKIIFLEKKLAKIKELTHKKKESEQIIASLLDSLTKLETEKDSILSSIEFELETERKNAFYEVEILQDRIGKLSETIVRQKRYIRKSKRTLFTVFAVLVGETVLLVIML
jgi:hypothetical protein